MKLWLLWLCPPRWSWYYFMPLHGALPSRRLSCPRKIINICEHFLCCSFSDAINSIIMYFFRILFISTICWCIMNGVSIYLCVSRRSVTYLASVAFYSEKDQLPAVFFYYNGIVSFRIILVHLLLCSSLTYREYCSDNADLADFAGCDNASGLRGLLFPADAHRSHVRE